MGLTACNGILGGREGKERYREGCLCLRCVFWEGGGKEGRGEWGVSDDFSIRWQIVVSPVC